LLLLPAAAPQLKSDTLGSASLMPTLVSDGFAIVPRALSPSCVSQTTNSSPANATDRARYDHARDKVYKHWP